LLAVEPQYPASAAARGTAGFVEVEFTVTALGLVENARVIAAEPQGVFEQAALAAIARWRYSPGEGREAVAHSHRFDFKPEQAVIAASQSGRAPAETAIDALIARSAALPEGPENEVSGTEAGAAVRNHCIREQLSYDFGEMVEANLMNTCSEPLMVYSCAEGLGRYYDRWVCQSTENAKSILVRPGDRLAGNVAMVEVPEGVRTYRYAQDLFVARARNTAYWWLACGVEDNDCRGSGRQWARSMDGKPAEVDPQLWTELSVARSS
jgi:TonB family protein